MKPTYLLLLLLAACGEIKTEQSDEMQRLMATSDSLKEIVRFRDSTRKEFYKFLDSANAHLTKWEALRDINHPLAVKHYQTALKWKDSLTKSFQSMYP